MARRAIGLDELCTPQVHNRPAGDSGFDAEDGAALEGSGTRRHVVAVGDLARKGDPAQQKARVSARDEAKLERAHFADDGLAARARLDDLDALLGHARGAAEGRRRPRAEDAGAGDVRDGRDVEGVVEVGVPYDDGIRTRKVAPDESGVGYERRPQAVKQRCSRDIRIEEHGVPGVFEDEPRGSQPADPHVAGPSRVAEGIRRPGDVLGAHLQAHLATEHTVAWPPSALGTAVLGGILSSTRRRAASLLRRHGP